MIIHFLTLFVFSFGLSKVEFIDYKTIDDNNLKYNPLVDLPKAEYNNVSYYDYFMGIYINPEDNEKILFRNHENDIADSYLDFLDYKLKTNKRFQEKISIRILAYNNTEMSVVKKLERQITKGEINYVIYGTFEDNIVGKRFSRKGVKIMIKDSLLFEDNALTEVNPWKPVFLEVEKDFHPTDTTKIEIGKDVKINNLLVSNDVLAKKFSSLINTNSVFEYNYSLRTKYQDYITVLSAHLKAIDNLRNKNRMVELLETKGFRYKNKPQYIKDQQRLRDEFPFRVIEKIN